MALASTLVKKTVGPMDCGHPLTPKLFMMPVKSGPLLVAHHSTVLFVAKVNAYQSWSRTLMSSPEQNPLGKQTAGTGQSDAPAGHLRLPSYQPVVPQIVELQAQQKFTMARKPGRSDSVNITQRLQVPTLFLNGFDADQNIQILTYKPFRNR